MADTTPIRAVARRFARPPIMKGGTSMEEVDRYIDAIPEPRRAKAELLRSLIRATVPAATESMQHQMPAFDLGGSIVGLANQKSYLSLYFCSEAIVADIKAKYPALKCGKGCINFTDKDALPVVALVRALRKAAAVKPSKRASRKRAKR
jgi:uncharacterized protein YdhG (YjbR/CyaY superfamily)